MTTRYRSPRGTHDVLPAAAPRWRWVEETFRRTCADFGYEEIRTPAFEQAELFVRAVGEHTDIVSKEMFRVQGGEGEAEEAWVLRPEGTAPTLRACLQHGLDREAPLTRLYYLSSIFRYERPQAGRLREHHQAGIEALGSDDPALDVEVLLLGLTYLHRVGIRGEQTQINSVGCPGCRPAFRAALRESLRERISAMCENCRRRYDTNPLRILDCKAEDWERLEGVVPDILDSLCAGCAGHFQEVRRLLDLLDVEYVRNPRLVRGLDYYVRTSFEITHSSLGAQSTVLGGGRYDGLVEAIGGGPTPGIGFGSGIERVLLVCEATGAQLPVEARRPVFVITLGAAAREPGLRLLYALRHAGMAAEIDYLGRSMKAQLRAAHRAGARWAAILGDEEVARGAAAIKDMETGAQEAVPLDDVVRRLRV